MRILIAIAAATIGGIAMFIGLFAACAGFAWIFVFGDNPWPSWSGAALILIPAAGALIGAASLFRMVMGARPVP